ncbi:hypothetical protein KY285_037231 [Solanum tuberosum]|nr:hypothetical protein KY285_037231 [Solanum tuberosum]
MIKNGKTKTMIKIEAAESIEAKKLQMSSDQPNDLKEIEDINANEGLADAVEASVEVSHQWYLIQMTRRQIVKVMIVESKLLEAEDQATENVPNKEELQHNERENPDSTELKLAFSEDKEHEQHDKAEQDKQRISTELSPNAPTLELKAVSSNERDVGRQMELSDSSKAEEEMEDVHVVSLAKDLPASDNPELLKDFKDYNKHKSSFPLDLVSSEEICSVKDDIVAASEIQADYHPILVSSILNSNGLQEPEDSSKNSLSDAKQSTEVDDPVIERTEETSFTMEEVNKGRHPDNELLANNETTPVAISCLSEAIQTTVTLGGNTTVHESRKEIFHEASEDASISNDAKALESASATGLDSKVISDCDVKEPTDLNSRIVDTDFNSRVGDTDLNNCVGDTDLNNRVVDNSPAGDVLKSATGVISSASQNEGDDKLIKQNETVSAMDTPISSSSRADSLDTNWGSISVLSTQSESTAILDAETTDTQRLEKSEHDLQKPTYGSEECHPDKSDVYEPPSFMTLVEWGESSANKKATASEIETQLNDQQPKAESLKAGWFVCYPTWFPSITNVVNESQGRKKNEEIIAKVTNWSTGKQQHTPLKSLLGEARSPNVKQVPPSTNKKDETASTKTTTVNSILSSEAPTAVSKEAEKEWNSPARYPVDIKKEKRKTKPYWVLFVCCSSVHQDS